MCWLCAFQGEALGAKLHAFIIKHIGIMDMACIAQQVSDFLLLNQKDAVGAEKEVVYEHIARHMLHPRVRTAVLLRQLLDFMAVLQTSLIVSDAGVCTVDKSNAELYLKVMAQAMSLYRMDTTTMLFGDDEKENAGVSTVGEAAGGAAQRGVGRNNNNSG